MEKLRRLVGIIFYFLSGILVLDFILLGPIGLGGGLSFYRIKEKYGAVVTRFNGDRFAQVKDGGAGGLHLKLVTLDPRKWIFKVEEFSLRQEYIPDKGEMQAMDKITFPYAWLWIYQIEDLEKFGIVKGQNALEMLKKDLNGIATDVIQSKDIEYIFTHLGELSNDIQNHQEVKKVEVGYGVKIISFRLTQAQYPKAMSERAAEAKFLKIKGDAIEVASKKIAKSRMNLADANKILLEKLISGSGVVTEEGKQKALDVLRDLNFYEMLDKKSPGDTTFVIPRGDVPSLTIPVPEKKEADAVEEPEREKIKEEVRKILKEWGISKGP